MHRYVNVLLRVCFCCASGFVIGQMYFNYFIKCISLVGDVGYIGLALSVILALSSAVSVQVRCVSLLLIPMYCGKAGRGVLKVVVLTYVIAGPITNMGLNAREVVRVFTCSRQLSAKLSCTEYAMTSRPLGDAMLSMAPEMGELKRALRSIRDVIAPIEQEIVDMEYILMMKEENEQIRLLLGGEKSNNKTNSSHQTTIQEKQTIQEKYQEKISIRCEHHLSHGVEVCLFAFKGVFKICRAHANNSVCRHLRLPEVCDIRSMVERDICDSGSQINPELGRKYEQLISIQADILTHLKEIKIEKRMENVTETSTFQQAMETSERIQRAFDEKTVVLQAVSAMVHVFVALLVLRIAVSAYAYHHRYLTDNDFDNVYVTGYFKRIDERRRRKCEMSLLPLKKMERSRYIDVKMLSYIPPERGRFLTQVLKVMLEAVTATTFVMLDRLFYEALEMVRLHTLTKSTSSLYDIDIEVIGKGAVADMMRKIVTAIGSSDVKGVLENASCPLKLHATRPSYYVRIYGGYLWILLLVYLDPCTLRLRRLICSYFYPKREKQRILHLYNDILKKRMRLQKTLRRKAVQAVRVHYLSGESLLSLRMKCPRLLGWLDVFPTARMKCLICEEIAPRSIPRDNPWHHCINKKCPFVYCEECWRESARCLACDPAIADLSDIDSLSDQAHVY